MATTKGFFSIIQHCPDLDRGESANVGVVLVVPELAFLGVRTERIQCSSARRVLTRDPSRCGKVLLTSEDSRMPRGSPVPFHEFECGPLGPLGAKAPRCLEVEIRLVPSRGACCR